MDPGPSGCEFKNTLHITAEQAQDMIYPILSKQEIP
jgi:hypothetical protein